jgi:ubiquinone/menaquinone biosynthesis C-methylase UbiE
MSAAITIRTYGRRLRRKEREYNQPRPLASYLVPLLPDRIRVRIADLGSGPFSTVGTKHPRKFISVIASDSLAREYNKMLSRRGIKPLIPVKFQDMHHLTYRDSRFDIVHCANALDHTADPAAALREMLRICRPGGYIHLRHFPNEGERKNYTGFHRWNIERVGDDCRIWNKESSFLLSTILPGATTTATRPGTKRETIISTYRKV